MVWFRRAIQANTSFLPAARRPTTSYAVGDKFWLIPANELADRLHASSGGIAMQLAAWLSMAGMHWFTRSAQDLPGVSDPSD